MDIFGHVGLTLAAAYAADRLLREPLERRRQTSGVSEGDSTEPPDETNSRLFRAPDYRLVIVASLLPDIVDKPLGVWIAPDLVNHGLRSVAHSAAFALILMAASSAVPSPRWGHSLIALSFGSAWHLVLDQMWKTPSTVLWPALGWAFPVRSVAGLSELSSSYLRDHLTFYTAPWEVAGALVILLFAVRLYRRRAYVRFFRSGVVA